MSQKTIFLSGANITKGGPLVIYNNVLKILNKNFNDYQVKAIVSDSKLFTSYNNVEFIEYKKYKKFILLKFYYEYIKYYFVSKKQNICLWVSLNDCTPNVIANKRVVYCHNATPFYNITFEDFIRPTRIFFQSFYYILFYSININKNDFIIVQQNWIKDFLKVKFKIFESKFIINRPNSIPKQFRFSSQNCQNKFYTFIYPTKAERYKNIEVLLKASQLLVKSGVSNFRLNLTLDINENRFSKYLFEKYKNLEQINWIGFVSREKLEDLYQQSDCLVFCSKLETWGLPLSEFKVYNRPILVSNLPYSKETIDDYKFCKYFDPDDANELSRYMKKLILDEDLIFDVSQTRFAVSTNIKSLEEIFDFLLHNTINKSFSTQP